MMPRDDNDPMRGIVNACVLGGLVQAICAGICLWVQG